MQLRGTELLRRGRSARRADAGPATAGRASYRAFISYSHAADGKLAPTLQSGLHRFAKPWYRLRAIRVFRDEASLSANPALWQSIVQALSSSDWFVLLASPESASSEWVGKEVSYWLATKAPERLLIALTGGELTWDERAGDFDWDRTNALPPVLRGVFAEEPRYIDVRWARTAEDVSLRNPQFRSTVAEIAAPLHGLPKDELIGEDVRQHRRTVRIARAVGVTLALLVIAAAALAFLALQQRNTALAQRDRAEQEARLANSRRLAALADGTLGRRLGLGVLLALEAYRIEPTVEARSAVTTALLRTERTRAVLRSPPDVLSVGYSADGKRLLTTDGGGHARLWALEPPRKLVEMACSCVSASTGAALTPDGRRVVTASGSRGITIWDAQSGRALESRPDTGYVGGVAVSADGRFLVSYPESFGELEGSPVFGEQSDPREISVWDLRRLVRLGSLPGSTSVKAAAFSPRRPVLAVSDLTGVSLWNAAERRRLAHFAEPKVMSVAFSRDGRTLASGSEGGDIVLRDVASGRRLRRLHQPAWVTGLAFDRDAKILMSSGDDRTVRIWSLPQRRLTATLVGHDSSVEGIAASPDGSSFVSAGQDGTARIWDRAPRPFIQSLTPGLALDEVAVAPDGNTVAAGESESPTFVIDIARRKRWRLGAASEELWTLDFSPDGRRLAAADGNGTVSVWDVARRRRIGEPLRGGRGAMVAADFSPDGRLLVGVGQDGWLALWNARTLRPVWRKHFDEVFDAGAFLDARTLAVAGFTLDLWDVAKRRRRLRVSLPASDTRTLAVDSPHGRFAVGGDDGRILLFTTSGKRIGEPLLGATDSVDALAFSSDGRTLASGSTLEDVRLWDVTSRRALGSPIKLPVGSLAFSRDGRRLLAGSAAGAVLVDPILWRGNRASFLARLCPIAGRDLTRSEWREFLPDEPYRATCGGGAAAG